MTIMFTILASGDIIAAEPESTLEKPLGRFSTEQELQELTTGWRLRRLVELWNQIPGLQPVSKFENRTIAVHRIWKALSRDTESPQTEERPSGGRPRNTGKRSRASQRRGPRENSKAAQVIALLQRPHGASLGEIMEVTGWQRHSVRGFVSGDLSKKRKLNVRSFTREDERVYQIRSRSN